MAEDRSGIRAAIIREIGRRDVNNDASLGEIADIILNAFVVRPKRAPRLVKVRMKADVAAYVRVIQEKERKQRGEEGAAG